MPTVSNAMLRHPGASGPCAGTIGAVFEALSGRAGSTAARPEPFPA